MPQVLKYCLEPQRIELIGQIGRPAVEERRIAPLMLMNVAAAQREPVILALVSNIAVEADDRASGLPFCRDAQANPAEALRWSLA